MDPLEAISPIDGRYHEATAPLARIFSESGLMRYRARVEVEYLIALSENPNIDVREFTNEEAKMLRECAEITLDDAAIIHAIEVAGHNDLKPTNHDVKAGEYFLKEKLAETSLKDCLEFIHFGLTSEDVNNIAYALMLRDGILDVLLPALEQILTNLEGYAHNYAALPMLARTHGQPASPTTFGKEFKVFAARLGRQIIQLKQFKILAKLNGATGNYNAHLAAYPDVDWVDFTDRFVSTIGGTKTIQLEANRFTTQIESHDTYAELFDIFRRINMILIDFNQDMWRYISDGWIAQKAVEGEVGSSTMPHKVNPIKFENSEGNLGLANALLHFFSTKLPISRLQRDLSDSTVQRSFGTAFAHCLMGYSSLLKALDRIRVDEAAVQSAVHEHPEVLAEAIQTILRREGTPMPYEQLKTLTRGNAVTLDAIRDFVDTLDVSEEIKKELKALTPETYIGLAKKLAEK